MKRGMGESILNLSRSTRGKVREWVMVWFWGWAHLDTERAGRLERADLALLVHLLVWDWTWAVVVVVVVMAERN